MEAGAPPRTATANSSVPVVSHCPRTVAGDEFMSFYSVILNQPLLDKDSSH